MSAVLWALDPQGENLSAMNAVTAEGRAKIAKYFPDCDIHDSSSSIYKGVATNIYKTKDAQFFHLHGRLIQMFLLYSADCVRFNGSPA